MATLQSRLRTTQDVDTIRATLADLRIDLAVWSVGDHPELRALLARPALDEAEKAQVLHHLDHRFEELKASAGYTSRDLIVLHREVPNLEELLAKFDKCHTHDDDEVRYIVDGEGTFGFVTSDGEQLRLTVRAGEFINVPARTEHWFELTDTRRIKAVRYFTGTAGWVPSYTGTTITPVRT
ncbi:MAG: cupin domain-containing protein [Myxococcales bacterium]|nr:cupin domain-containing protein [Myxococcales bacterium]